MRAMRSGVARGLEARRHQLAHDVHAGGVDREAVVRGDEEIGRPDGLQQRGDLAIGVADGRAGRRRADPEGVLRVVGLGEPGEHDGRLQHGQHVLAQDAHGPGDGRVVALAALGRRRPEAGQDRVAQLARIGERLAGLEESVDEGADARRRSRIEQPRAAGRARADRGQRQAARVQPLGQRRHQRQPSARHLVQPHEPAVVLGAERPRRLDRGHVHLVADDAVRGRLRARHQRGRVHPRHRRKHRVAVREVDALRPQPCQRRRVLHGDLVGPQPIHDEHDDRRPPSGHQRRRPSSRASARSASGWSGLAWRISRYSR